MARTMSSAMLAAIQSASTRPAIFLEATFVTGTVYLWTGIGTIAWNSHSWIGIGTFGGITAIEEGANVQARGITLTTSGFDPVWLAHVKDEFQLGAPVIVRLGFFDEAPALITDPVIAWAGKMDQPVIDVGAATAIISIACENRLVLTNVPCQRRFTNDDQQLDYPGDNGMSFVNGMQETTVTWGVARSDVGNR